MSVVFVHFEVAPRVLEPHVPFALDVRDGCGYVSVVAFKQERLRFGRWFAPEHAFLNVRTYVRVDEEPGIFFLTEWVNSRLALTIAPPLYGLPCRFGRLEYREDSGSVTDAAGSLAYRVAKDEPGRFQPCASGSVDEFLLERYAAFTQRKGVRRRFRIRHQPWPQVCAKVGVTDDSLLRATFPWWLQTRQVGANFSPGVREVWIGRPERVV